MIKCKKVLLSMYQLGLAGQEIDGKAHVITRLETLINAYQHTIVN